MVYYISGQFSRCSHRTPLPRNSLKYNGSLDVRGLSFPAVRTCRLSCGHGLKIKSGLKTWPLN